MAGRVVRGCPPHQQAVGKEADQPDHKKFPCIGGHRKAVTPEDKMICESARRSSAQKTEPIRYRKPVISSMGEQNGPLSADDRHPMAVFSFWRGDGRNTGQASRKVVVTVENTRSPVRQCRDRPSP